MNGKASSLITSFIFYEHLTFLFVSYFITNRKNIMVSTERKIDFRPKEYY